MLLKQWEMTVKQDTYVHQQKVQNNFNNMFVPRVLHHRLSKEKAVTKKLTLQLKAQFVGRFMWLPAKSVTGVANGWINSVCIGLEWPYFNVIYSFSTIRADHCPQACIKLLLCIILKKLSVCVFFVNDSLLISSTPCHIKSPSVALQSPLASECTVSAGTVGS